MKTLEKSSIPSEVLADLEYAARLAAEGKTDADFARRVHAEAENIRDDVFRRHSTMDIGVPAIRSLRDQE